MSNETPTIPPALTAEEWAEKREGPWDEHRTRAERDVFFAVLETQLDRHALAALCLHEQPFGFTREDVVKLRQIPDGVIPGYGSIDDGEWFLSLIARLAALLPPEG